MEYGRIQLANGTDSFRHVEQRSERLFTEPLPSSPEDVQHLFLSGRIQIQIFGPTQFLCQIGQLSLPAKGIVHEVDQDVSSGPGLVEHSQLIMRIAQLGAVIHDFQKSGASRCQFPFLQVEYAGQIQGRFGAGQAGQGPVDPLPGLRR